MLCSVVQYPVLCFGAITRIVEHVTYAPPEPAMTQLRVVLARAREHSGWTFDELAERSGVSRQTLLNLNSGKHAGDLKTWLKLSRTFGVGLDELLAPVWD